MQTEKELALSIQQPWAELIVSGKKTIEIRSWRTQYRGWILIHASSHWDHTSWPLRQWREPRPPTGGIIGRVRLDDIIEIDAKRWRDLQSRRLVFSSYDPHYCRFGFLLSHAERLPFRPALGQLFLHTPRYR